jgi:hypothetical protein
MAVHRTTNTRTSVLHWEEANGPRPGGMDGNPTPGR